MKYAWVLFDGNNKFIKSLDLIHCWTVKIKIFSALLSTKPEAIYVWFHNLYAISMEIKKDWFCPHSLLLFIVYFDHFLCIYSWFSFLFGVNRQNSENMQNDIDEFSIYLFKSTKLIVIFNFISWKSCKTIFLFHFQI